MMFDVLVFDSDAGATEEALLATLPGAYVTPASSDGPIQINPSRGGWTSIVLADVTYDMTQDPPVVTSPRQVMPGVVCWFRMTERDPVLEALPTCRLVCDWNAWQVCKAAMGQTTTDANGVVTPVPVPDVSTWRIYVKPGTQLTGVKLDPIIDGTDYDFS